MDIDSCISGNRLVRLQSVTSFDSVNPKSLNSDESRRRPSRKSG